jgi:hypothetical protein
MESLLETIHLDMEESNQLLFKVKVDGAEQAPAKIRLVCESGDLAFMFNGRSAGGDGLVEFNLPVMRDKLKEGVYSSRVEVLIENRYFAPVQFNVNFKKAIKVVAEAVSFNARPTPPEIKVSVVPVTKTSQVTHKEIMPAKLPEKQTLLARQNAQVTLKERYHNKHDDPRQEEVEPDEEAILKAAKTFINNQRKK